MIDRTISELKKDLEDLKVMRISRAKQLEKVHLDDKVILRESVAASGKKYYCAYKRDEGKTAYIGNAESEWVNAIKTDRFLRKTIQIIDDDIKTVEYALQRLKGVGYDEVNEALPKAYRNPRLVFDESGDSRARRWKKNKTEIKSHYDIYKPEELKVRTDDGTYVRSKSEAMIYNHFLSRGVTFVYEMPTEINGTVLWPDFVVLSEQDYKTEIIIEHQGMMQNEAYRSRFNEKLYSYMRAGYIQGINIFYTFDGLDGSFDKTPVEDIINTRILRSS